MKKFILGLLSGLGVLGVGKIVYEKGRHDQAKDLRRDFDNILKGIEMKNEEKKES